MIFNKKNNNNRRIKRPLARPSNSVHSRLVTGSRWVHRNQLEIGMYVNELDKPWTETSFMFQGFRIDSPEVLMAVQEACEYVNVQQEKEAYISSNSPMRFVAASK